jgi:hypothetical protein
MPPRTRYQIRHLSIRGVHADAEPAPPSDAAARRNRRAAQMRRRLHANRARGDQLAQNLQEYIRLTDILSFVREVFSGDFRIHDDSTVARQDVLRLLHANQAFRGFVSNLWRQETDQHHEWIPCTYLSEIIRKAVSNNDFRYIWLAHTMRSPTKDIIYKPRLENRGTVSGTVYKIPQAHPGGLNFRIPGGDPLGRVPVGQAPADRAALTDQQQDFHTAIIQTLRDANSPRNLVARLLTVYQTWCWNGNFPVNTIPGRAEIWPYYFEHATAIDVCPAAAVAAAPLAYAATAYANVIAAFTQWDNDVQGRTRTNTNY